MIAGRFVSGTFKAMSSAEYLTPQALSIPHQVYELRMQTNPMDADMERRIIEELMSVKVQGMQVLAVETEGASGKVKMQVTGSPFFWAPLLAILPQIIVPLIALIIGVILVFRIPDWAWAALPISAGGAILLYAIYKTRK